MRQGAFHPADEKTYSLRPSALLRSNFLGSLRSPTKWSNKFEKLSNHPLKTGFDPL